MKDEPPKKQCKCSRDLIWAGFGAHLLHTRHHLSCSEWSS